MNYNDQQYLSGLIGDWKDPKGQKMQIKNDGTMFINGSKYLFEVHDDILDITAKDMKIKAKFKFSGQTLLTTINGSTNKWEKIPTTSFCTKCGAAVLDSQSFCAKCGTPLKKPQNDGAEQAFEKYLKSEFGLTYLDNASKQWSFDGMIATDLADSFNGGATGYEIIKGLSTSKHPFSGFSIIYANQVVIVFNSKPSPSCFLTNLSSDDIITIITSAVKDGGKMREYHGLFFVSLSE